MKKRILNEILQFTALVLTMAALIGFCLLTLFTFNK